MQVLAGAAIALITVRLTNSSNDRRATQQLVHDSTQKSTDRLIALRREVYVEALDQFAIAGQTLASLADPNLERAEAGAALTGFYAAAQKLIVVGEPKTAILANDLGSLYSEIWMKSLVAALPIGIAFAKVKVTDATIQTHLDERSRILAKMRAEQEDRGVVDHEKFNVLQKNFEFEGNQLDNAVRERDLLLNEVRPRHFQFSRELLADIDRVNAVQVELAASLRADLGISGELPDLRDRMKKSRELLAQHHERLLSAVPGQGEEVTVPDQSKGTRVACAPGTNHP